MKESNPQSFNLRAAWQRIKKRKTLFATVLVITFILSCVYIVPIPRVYNSSVTLAPEVSNAASGGSLASMASSFGFDLGSLSGDDAVYPMLYPDVMSSNEFIVSLFNIKVTSAKGDISTDYYTYLTKHYKQSPWDKGKKAVKGLIGALLPHDNAPGRGTPGRPDPFMLSREEDELVNGVRGLIKCSVDKKTEIITISVSDQDRLICATLADSVRVRLQKWITDYRTKKARTDLQYYHELAEEALKDYDRKSRSYASYADSHVDNVLAMGNVQETKLENEMQTAFGIYEQYKKQEQFYEGEVQKNTPAFVVIKEATVPVKPSAPKRMIFVLAMMFFAAAVTAFIVCRDLIFKKNQPEEEPEPKETPEEEPCDDRGDVKIEPEDAPDTRELQ